MPRVTLAPKVKTCGGRQGRPGEASPTSLQQGTSVRSVLAACATRFCSALPRTLSPCRVGMPGAAAASKVRAGAAWAAHHRPASRRACASGGPTHLDRLARQQLGCHPAEPLPAAKVCHAPGCLAGSEQRAPGHAQALSPSLQAAWLAFKRPLLLLRPLWLCKRCPRWQLWERLQDSTKTAAHAMKMADFG